MVLKSRNACETIAATVVTSHHSTVFLNRLPFFPRRRLRELPNNLASNHDSLRHTCNAEVVLASLNAKTNGGRYST
jgi:hypothetical protein